MICSLLSCVYFEVTLSLDSVTRILLLCTRGEINVKLGLCYIMGLFMVSSRTLLSFMTLFCNDWSSHVTRSVSYSSLLIRTVRAGSIDYDVVNFHV